jgi:hypothetical protein
LTVVELLKVGASKARVAVEKRGVDWDSQATFGNDEACSRENAERLT